MKPLILIISFLLITSISYAQNPVVDTYRESIIYAIDYSTGQETPATFDAAILFKDSFIDLVRNTNIAKITGIGPGHKVFIITQMDPQTNGNAYQLILQRKVFGQTYTNYTFVYNVDQNTLSWLNPQTQSYALVPIQGFNSNNLNNCFTYGKFNFHSTMQTIDAANQPPPADPNAQPAMDPAADSITVNSAPPALQDEVQPECPTDGYLWQPGNWAYNPTGGYYWVPGAWVAVPTVGFLWTPPYWAFINGVYLLNAGYWGNTVGFYGGINYGYGYAGEGFNGGRWDGNHFRYNTAVMRVNGRFQYRYEDRSAVFHGERNRSAFNGRGGIERGPSVVERGEFDRRNNEVTRMRAENRINTRRGVVPGPGVKPPVGPGVKPPVKGGGFLKGLKKIKPPVKRS